MPVDLHAFFKPHGKRAIYVFGYLDEDRGYVLWAAVLPDQGYSVAEIRVFPADPVFGTDQRAMDMDEYAGAPAGRWSRRYETTPAGGVPFSRLRDIRESDLQQVARDAMAELGKHEDIRQTPAWREMAGVDGPLQEATQTTEERLALLADRYVELVESGEEKVAERLGEMYGRDASWAAGEIYRARNYGVSKDDHLLTPSYGRGKPGGSLTKRAKEVLSRLERRAKGDSDA